MCAANELLDAAMQKVIHTLPASLTHTPAHVSLASKLFIFLRNPKDKCPRIIATNFLPTSCR